MSCLEKKEQKLYEDEELASYGISKPANFETVSIAGATWVSYKTTKNSEESVIYCTPIADDRYLYIRHSMIYQNQNKIEKLRAIFLQRQNLIMNSISLTLP